MVLASSPLEQEEMIVISDKTSSSFFIVLFVRFLNIGKYFKLV